MGDMMPLITLFMQLGYMDSHNDPIVPAIAKFFHVNQLGALTVWPEQCPRVIAHDLIMKNKDRKWNKCLHNLAYIHPRTKVKDSKAVRAKFGTATCAQAAD